MNNERENDDFLNPMINHYQNAELNAFNEEGLNIRAVKENSRLWLSLPSGLKKNAIYNIMKQFGQVVKIDVPFDLSKKQSRIFAFVEYATFKEAEKALRELNNSKNEGLEIRAEFAHPKTERVSNEVPIMPAQINETVEEEVPQIPIHIDLNHFKVDDTFERVHFFNYNGPYVADVQESQQKKYIKSCAAKSLGQYDQEENCFEYNMQLREYNFLTFYCCICDNEATLMFDDPKRYFCTKECAEYFLKRSSNNDTVVADYQPKKSDKVYLTAVINEKCVYVRPINEDINMVLETIHRKSNNCEPLKKIPEVNDQILVLLYDSFYRAQVLSIIDDDFITVKLTDIGNTACVSLFDAFEMPLECMDVKKITAKVMLNNIAVESINMDVIEYLLNLLCNNIELVIKEIDENGAELKDNTTNSSVNEKIVKLANFDSVKFDEANYISIMPDLIPFKNHEQKLFVVNIASLKQLGSIVCVAEKFAKDFQELYCSLNAYGKKVDPETYGICGNKPLCLIKYNHQWHRGVADARGDGKPECVLIDLQFMCKVNMEDIFQLPNVLAKFRVMTEIYQIEGYDKNEEVKNFCDQNIFENDFIVAEKVEIKDDVPIIYIKMTNK